MHTLLNPQSVCLVGASADPRKLAGKTLARLEQHGFPGRIHLVNPQHARIGARVSHRSIADVGEPVDVALISLPAAAVPTAVRECGAAAVGYVVVISSGFGEDARSGTLAQELADAVAESGVRLVGPNCEGIWSVPASMALTFGSAADRPQLIPGPISLISQSGSIGAACLRLLQDAGVGCRYFVSSGNESDLTAMDYLEYLVDEGGSDVIAMFVEGFRDGHRLRDIAARANAGGTRLLALCSGASELGRIATASHTGRISSASAVYRDLLAAAGVVQVGSFTDFVEAIKVGELRGLPLSAHAGSGVGVVALSGGSRALLADACASHEVPMARFSARTESALDAVLPRFGFSKNPTDLTGEIASDEGLFAEVIRTVIDDEHTEAVVVQYANAADSQVANHMDLYADLARTYDCPLVVSTLGGVSPASEARLRGIGVVCARDPGQAVRQLSWLYKWRDAAERKPQAAEAEAPEVFPGIPFAPSTSWADQVGLLELVGIPVPAWQICDGDVPLNLRYPVVLKAPPEYEAHKTEAGLVFLGIGNPEELLAALAQFRSRVRIGTPALVQEMAEGQLEVLMTVRRDPDFGPLLVIGAGGVTTEWQRDVVHVQLPASESNIERALRRLRLWPLLQPFRGRPACDVPALVQAACRLGQTYLSCFPDGSEIEINPLLVGPIGSGVVAVDVLYSGPRNPRQPHAGDS
jgi:acyl-CoA synthetase (NDP forming)